MSRQTTFEWTNRSVLRLAGKCDPIRVIESLARSLVFKAMDKGWSGPPYDPVPLADLLGITVQAQADIQDARTVQGADGQLIVQFNPNRPRGRVRFSVAHEITHTFFPDCSEEVRNRAHENAVDSDNWQLEMLCNIGAAEITMPLGSFMDAFDDNFEVEHLLKIQEQFGVSFEAALIRAVKLTEKRAAMFVASRIERQNGLDRFRIEYQISSAAWGEANLFTSKLTEDSPLGDCTAVGYTSRANVSWPSKQGRFRLECIGLPPYPGGKFPRVGGLLAPVGQGGDKEPRLEIVRGDALKPRGSGKRIIAHVVNDKTPNWGGRGFAKALKKRYPEIQSDFRNWVAEYRGKLQLGTSRFCDLGEGLAICSMIAQHGYGSDPKQRLRYWALDECLRHLAQEAIRTGASIHMPMIGTGYGGGAWPLIREIIYEALASRGVQVVIYQLPGRKTVSDDDLIHLLTK